MYTDTYGIGFPVSDSVTTPETLLPWAFANSVTNIRIDAATIIFLIILSPHY